MRRALPLFATLALIACTHAPPSDGAANGAGGDAPAPTTPATPAAESRGAGAIATIVTHDAKVSILGKGGDLRVVVRKNDGALVADGISMDELRALDPSLHAIVTNAVASGQGGTFVDATLGHPGHGQPQGHDPGGRHSY